jgi:hypothetical protein
MNRKGNIRVDIKQQPCHTLSYNVTGTHIGPTLDHGQQQLPALEQITWQ